MPKVTPIRDDNGQVQVTEDGKISCLNEATQKQTDVDISKLWNDAHEDREDARANRLKVKELQQEYDSLKQQVEDLGGITPAQLKELREKAEKPPGTKELSEEEIDRRVDAKYGTQRAELESETAAAQKELEKLNKNLEIERAAHDTTFKNQQFRQAVRGIDQFDPDFEDDAIRLLRDEFEIHRDEETGKRQMISTDEFGKVRPGTEPNTVLTPSERLTFLVKDTKRRWLKQPDTTPRLDGSNLTAESPTTSLFEALIPGRSAQD